MKPMPDLVTRQRAAYDDELERLAEDAPVPWVAEPSVPAPFLALVSRAISEAPGQAEALVYYHADLLQRRRVAVLAGRAALSSTPLAKLLSTPLSLAKMPRLAAAIDRLGAWVSIPRVDGRTFTEIYADCYYGRYAPPLGTSDQELAAMADEGLGPLETLDRRLAGPLLHELTHLHRERDPLHPYLDECVAAALGARAMPALISPDDDPRTPSDTANAMVGAGWFVQVGEHLFLAFGFEQILAAHAGKRAWADVLPPGLPAAFAQLGWEQYLERRHIAFLGEAQEPDPWVKLIHLARGGLSRLPKDGLLEILRRLDWRDVPDMPDADLDPMRRAFARAFMARPVLGDHGQWRVVREPLDRTFDPHTKAWVAPRDATGLAFRWVLGPVLDVSAP